MGTKLSGPGAAASSIKWLATRSSVMSRIHCPSQVEDLHELSARRHARASTRSRCFRRVMLCSIQNMISPPLGVTGEEHRCRPLQITCCSLCAGI